MARKYFIIIFVALFMLLTHLSSQAKPAEDQQPNENPDFWYPLAIKPRTEATGVNTTFSEDTYSYWSYLTYERGYSIHVVDINQDGWDDVIFSTQPYRLRIWLQNPSCHALEEWLDLPTEIVIFDIDAADLNQDGELEIVVIGMTEYDFVEGTGYVQIYLPTEDGYAPSESVYTVGIGPRKVEVADVSGDTKADILVTSLDVLDVLVQQPDGSYIVNIIDDPQIEPNEYSNSVVSGDFNGDGRNDAAVQVVNRAESVIVYYQNTMGGLDPGIDLPWPFPPNGVTISGDSMAAGDINGDELVDLMAITNYNTPYANVVVYDQLPAGGFAAPEVIETYQTPISPNMGDMDNDGRVDLVLMNNGYGTFTVHYQLPEGGLGAEIHRPGGDIQWHYPHQDLASIGDVTGDGKLDIVYLGVNDGLVVITEGLKPSCPYDGPIPARKPGFLVGIIEPFAARKMISGDINEDGLGDFLTFSSDPDDPSVPVIQFITQGPPGYFYLGDFIQLNGLVEPNSLSVGDLNGDGRIDIAVADNPASPGVVGVIYHSSTEAFLPPVLLTVNDNPQQVYIADWDNDGLHDLAVIADGGITVFTQQDDGELAPPTIFNPGEIGTTYLGDDVDWNQDGMMDLATWWRSDLYSDQLRVFLQQEEGGFNLLPTARSSWPNTLVTGDLNSDNRPDIAISYYDNEPEARLELFYQSPDGFLSDREIISGPDYNSPDDMTIADLNFDGLDDILVMNAGGFGISAFTQNKAHTFDPPVKYEWYLWNNVYSHSIAQVDTDGDGKEDVFAYASGDNYVLFLKPVPIYEIYLPVIGR